MLREPESEFRPCGTSVDTQLLADRSRAWQPAPGAAANTQCQDFQGKPAQ